MMKTRRKKIMPPSMPKTPEGRIAEVQMLLTELVELVDHDHYDVYDSVFFNRVVQIMDGMSFKSVEELDDGDARKAFGLKIRDTGREILATKATSTKLFVRFFKSIVDYMS
jgi:hypothetical protein